MTLELLLLANGNYHTEPSLRAARLGTVTDYDALQAEAIRITTEMPYSSVETKGHVTNWTKPVGEVRQWSLWNNHGNTADTSQDFNYVMHGKSTPFPTQYPAIKAFTDKLPDLVNLRLNCIMPGSALSPHEEHLPIRLPDNQVALRARFHIPIQTNPDAKMLADDRWFRFKQGGLYAFNNGCVHGAKNEGDVPRYHLVWDMLMTERAFRLMFEEGGDVFSLDPDWDLPYTGERILEYAPSGGMSYTDFTHRRLVFHP